MTAQAATSAIAVYDQRIIHSPDDFPIPQWKECPAAFFNPISD
ncbi:MAG: hypothetical protein V7K41_24770 [Nostoc sp.]